MSLQDARAQKHTLKKVLIASAFLLGSLSAVLEIESDRAYSRYLEVADPARMSSLYDKGERYRNLSSVALVAAEVCAVTFVVLSLREKPTKQPVPDAVRISFRMRPSGPEVSLVW